MNSDKTFFGHPRGLITLFFTEMWERFSYYGMRAMLILFMVAPLENGGLGFSEKTSGAIYGLYTMFVYLLALPGGWLADRFFGLRKSVFYGGCIIMAGHFCLAVPLQETFFLGLLFIMVGTGMLKPTISSLVSKLYAEDEHVKRDNGYSIFYMGINLGAFLSPLLIGTLRAEMGWHYGFAAAGVGMALGLLQYKLTEKNMGAAGVEPSRLADPVQQQARDRSIRRGLWMFIIALTGLVVLMLLRVIVIDPVQFAGISGVAIISAVILYFLHVFAVEKLDHDERKKVIAIGICFMITCAFYTGYEGQGSSLNLFADKYTDLSVGAFVIPTEWFQSVPPIFVLLFVPLFVALWSALSRRNLTVSTPVKMALGLLFMGLAYVVMIGASLIVTNGDKPLSTWLIFTYMFLTFGEICLYPIGLSAITKLAPKRLVGQMMGVFFMALAFGNLLAGLFAGNFDNEAIQANPHLLADLFGLVAKIGLGAGLVILIFARPIRKLMGNVT